MVQFTRFWCQTFSWNLGNLPLQKSERTHIPWTCWPTERKMIWRAFLNTELFPNVTNNVESWNEECRSIGQNKDQKLEMWIHAKVESTLGHRCDRRVSCTFGRLATELLRLNRAPSLNRGTKQALRAHLLLLFVYPPLLSNLHLTSQSEYLNILIF